MKMMTPTTLTAIIQPSSLEDELSVLLLDISNVAAILDHFMAIITHRITKIALWLDYM